MSYEIIYNAQFLKTSKGKIVPALLSGSNNTYTSNKKRSRDWHCFAFPFPDNHRLDFEIEEIRELLKDCHQTDSFVKLHGKWANTKQYCTFIINCAKKAETIEELHVFDRPTAYWSVWKGNKNTIEGNRRLHSTDDLERFIQDFEYRKMNKEKGEKIYPAIQFPCEKFIHRNKRKRNPKPRLSEFYVLYVIKGTQKYYVSKLTARTLRYTYYAVHAKQFKTEQEALKWYADYKINLRFGVDLYPEFVNLNK